MSFVQISRKEGEREEKEQWQGKADGVDTRNKLSSIMKSCRHFGTIEQKLSEKNLLVRKHVRSLILSQSFGAQF